jgi:hypothetical protein
MTGLPPTTETIDAPNLDSHFDHRNPDHMKIVGEWAAEAGCSADWKRQHGLALLERLSGKPMDRGLIFGICDSYLSSLQEAANAT